MGHLPAGRIALAGIVTAFSGYACVYALNDIVDCSEDRRRLKLGCRDYGDYLDAAMLRHPVAQCAISMRAAIAWATAWGALALAGAIFLKPVCGGIFAGAAILETGYCLLGRVTPLRVLLSGIVKCAGPLAAIFAVDPAPSPWRLLLFFVWLVLWEIGGQNIPSDWSDVDEDRALGHKTLPVLLDAVLASRFVLAALCGSVVASILLGVTESFAATAVLLGSSAAAGLGLLILPAVQLARTRRRSDAMVVFNRASFYPVCLLAGVSLSVIVNLR